MHDITERKQAEEALRREHDKAQYYLDTVEAMMVALDTAGHITLVNRKACQLLGYAEHELIGKNWFTTCLPAAALEDEVYQVFEQIMAGEFKHVEYYENPVLTCDGEERVIAWHNNLLRDKDGNIIGSLSAGEDITERKQAEEALHLSEESLRQAQSVAHVGSWSLDIHGNTLTWSDETYHIFGIDSTTTLTYKKFLECLHSDDEQQVDDAWQKALAGNEYNVEHRIIVDGKIKWVHEKASIEFDKEGNAIRALGTTQDITERKQVEEKIKNSERELRGILDSLLDVYYRTDKEGRLLQISPSVQEVVGYRPEEALGKPITNYWRYPEKRQEMLQVMQAGEGVVQNFETEIIRKGGEMIWASTNSHFYYDEQGNLGGVEGTFRDVTKRKQAEEKTRDLLKQNRSLTQRMFHIQEEERRHLARDLHDEVGQLLTALQMHAHLINKGCQTCEKDSPSSADVINDTAQKLHREIRSIIRRLRPGMLDELGLEYALAEQVDSWNHQQPDAHCILNIDGDISSLGANLDVTIYRVIQEALTNVSRYAEASQVTIRMNRKRTDDKQDWLLLSIEDDGKGMDLKQHRQGFGITGMRERIIGAGGIFKLNSSIGKGLQITASFPINSDVKDSDKESK
jgi:PAS domain S-box-containing protein